LLCTLWPRTTAPAFYCGRLDGAPDSSPRSNTQQVRGRAAGTPPPDTRIRIRSVRQLQTSLGPIGWDLTAEHLAKLNAATGLWVTCQYGADAKRRRKPD